MLFAGANDGAGTAQYSDVVSEDRDRTTVNGAVPTNLSITRRALTVLGAHGAREGPNLAERVGVQNPLDVLANRTIALGTHRSHLGGSAHFLLDRLPTLSQLANGVLRVVRH